ncbi:chromosome segregation protein SMC [Leuconostocaceae bacterium ESL0958]|nr:chromosome segregation protein SMC [Leuconostocaceae bacterium ESL0958]
MKLKTLEIAGFKSFANKTVIDFQQGMTGIVGPNGSGKSNIIEAIRWVMGEQSAKDLRGNKMADVIFAGTKSRAALNRAEVSLTFDNSDHYIPADFSEIRITRRLYRSGESAYQLNGAACRLKDIHELFMDTGLGRDGFSIISQGQVERIFSAKPEERRGIVEEVAGVYKYKQSKEKAVRDLAATDENLARVDDIVAEVAQRLAPLAAQAETAKAYLDKRQQYEELDQVQLTQSIWSLQQEVAATERAVTASAETLNSQQATLREQQAALSAARTQIQEQQANRDQLQADIVTLTQQREQAIAAKQLAAQAQENRKQGFAQVAEQLDRLTQQEKKQAVELATATESEQQLTAQAATIRATLQKLEREHGDQKLAAVKKALAQNHQDYVAVMQEVASSRNRVTFQEKSIAQHEQQAAAKRQALQATDQEVAACQQELAAYQSAHPDQAQTENPYEQELATAEATLTAAQANLEAKEQDWQQAAYQKDQVQARYDAQTALDEYAGFYHGVQHLMQPAVRQSFPGIEGVVAELIDVPSRYTKAIETVLAGALQQIVVDQTRTAKAVIAYMTKHRQGRVTLLPLDSVQPRSIRDLSAVQKEAGFIGVAADLVQMPAGMDNVLRSLLGTTLLAENLDAATRIGRACRHRFRIVSLDGQLVNAGGSITGGANQRQGSSVLSRQQELQQLSAQLTAAKETVQRLEEGRNQAQAERQQAQQQLADLQAASRDYENAGQAVDYERKALADRLNRAQTQQQTLQLDVQDLQAALADAQTELAQAKQDLAAATEQQAHTEAENQTLQEQVETVTAAQESYQKEAADFQVELARVEAACQNQHTQALRLQESLADCRQELATLAQEKAKLEEQTQAADNPAALATELTKVTAALQDKEAQVNTLANALTEQGATVQQLEAQVTEQQAVVNQASTDQVQVQNRYEQRQQQLERAAGQLQQRYGLTVQSAADVHETDLTAAELAAHLQQLKADLDAMGPVNVAAINEYETIQARHAFLSQQSSDLRTAKQTLADTIAEMDQEVQQRFQTTFTAIANNFAKVFTKMFAGGQAQLELTDPAHLLTTGIDIKAQPPGKKFQQMSLLSGGEKALTAISLLFAILEYRPVPFVILDEAEAALDEANVDRFANYLKNFAGQTQFITITHRKGTMVAAKVLYGVTMQEAGVSKMVAVNLEEAAATVL